MTKEEMLTLVIYKFGFEHEHTIEFAEALNELNTAEAEIMMNELLDLPLDEDEEEEP